MLSGVFAVCGAMNFEFGCPVYRENTWLRVVVSELRPQATDSRAGNRDFAELSDLFAGKRWATAP